jgi:hypothetical protein
MTYAEVTVIVAGALESEEITFNQHDLDEFIATVREAAEIDGLPTEVHILHHDHDDPTGEDFSCECVQYEQSHKPAFTFNLD